MKYIVIRNEEEYIGPFQSMPEAFGYIHSKIEQLTNDIELADDQWLETKGSFFDNEMALAFWLYTKHDSGSGGSRQAYFQVRPLVMP